MSDQQNNDKFTAKQRMREEIDSPFRKIRVVLFGFSTASALVALYFSLLTLCKSFAGFSEVPPLETIAGDVAINVGAVLVCGFLTYRDVKAGEANLERIAQGGKLASLRVAPAEGSSQKALGTLRNDKRLVIALGGEEYIRDLAQSVLTVAESLVRVDVAVVPVLIDSDDNVSVDKGRQLWREAQKDDAKASIADHFVHFPLLAAPWADYIAPEVATARSQNFDPVTKGLGIYVKKNGRILRRATGQPNWQQFIGTMDLMDGNKNK